MLRLNPELAIWLYRHIKSTRLKAGAVTALRCLGLRYFVLRMDTTNVCNLRCKMCYYSWQGRVTKVVNMDLDLFRKIATELFPVARALYLSCTTEPLMNKEFSSFVRLTGTYKVPFTSFCTNAQLLSQDVVDSSVDAGISEIIFSVDGATAATYEEIRRGAKWERLLRALELLRRRKEESKAKAPVGRINFTCIMQNIRELPAVVRLARSYGIASVHVRHFATVDTPEAHAVLDKQKLYTKIFNDVAAEARAVAKEENVRLVLPEPVQNRSSARSDKGASVQERNPYCVRPWYQGLVRSDGEYFLCGKWPHMGSLACDSFCDIYHGPKMRQIRRSLLSCSPDACSWDCQEEAFLPPENEGTGDE